MGQLAGNLHRQIELVRPRERPGFDAARAEVGGEFGRKTMQGENSLGSDIFHMPQEVVVAGMVGEREGGVATHAVNGSSIHCPAGDGGNAPFLHQRHGPASSAGGRANEDMARCVFCVPGCVLWENDALRFIDRDEFCDGGVEHDAHSRAAEVGKDFLRLAERIAKQDGRCAFLQGFDTKLEDLSHDLLERREHIARQPVGRLHNECLRPGVGGCLGTGALPELEVAGVEEAALFGFHKTLGGSQNMSGRQQAHAEFPKIAQLVEGKRYFFTVQGAHARFHEAQSGRCCDGSLVAACVVAVGV